MRLIFSAIIFATLPFAAGFAVSNAHAQDGGLQYSGPGIPSVGAPSMPVAGSPMGAAGDMTRMAQLEQQIRELTNQLEQRDFQIRQLQQTFDKFQADANARIQALESGSAVAPMASGDSQSPATEQPYTGPAVSSSTPPSPTPMQNGAPVSGTLEDSNGAFKPATTPQLGQLNEPAAGNPDGAITSGTPQGGAPSAAKAYDQAFSYLQQSNYQDAQIAFTNFLKTYPTHPLAANAQYWLGETYFAQTQYSTAAKTFAKAFQEHPQGQKAPDALLKLALTLEKMNKKEDACLTLGELSKRFPSGPASVLRRGTEEGTRMGCKV